METTTVRLYRFRRLRLSFVVDDDDGRDGGLSSESDEDNVDC
jgi:hypothetical protein